MSFVTHSASRQGRRYLQGSRKPGGELNPKPFLQGDTKYAENATHKKRRLGPANIGSSDSNGLVIHGRHHLQPDEPENLAEEDVEYNISYNGLGTLRFAQPVKIPTIIGDINVQGKIYVNGVELGTAPVPAILDINSTGTSIVYNATVGTAIGTLSAVGGTSPVVFSILTDTDNKFALSGATSNVLEVGNLFDYFTATSHDVTIRATDINSQTFDKTFTITLTIPPHTSTNGIAINQGGTTNEYLAAEGISGTDLDFVSSFTFAMWVKFTVSSPSLPLMNMGDSSSDTKISITEFNSLGERPLIKITDNLSTDETFWMNLLTLNDGNWHHIVLTYSTNDARFYYDGALQSKVFISNPALQDPLKATNNRMLIGSRLPGPNNTARDFVMSEISCWSTDMTASHVTELYNGGSQDFHPVNHSLGANLISWWSCNTINGSNNVEDEGPNGQLLTGYNIDSGTNLVPV